MSKVYIKNREYYFYFISIILILALVFGLISCSTAVKEEKSKDQYILEESKKKVSEGVISLFDSLGVGDVPCYPDATYDNELNDQLGEFKNQLIEIPAEFFNVLYTVYVTKDTVSEVESYYNLELQRLHWEKSLDLTSGNSSFNVWKKTADSGSDVLYIVITGEINYNNRKEVVILTGAVIPEPVNKSDNYTEETEEGSEIGPGSIYFENPMPPQGQGLLPTKPISLGVDEWEKWLQKGEVVEGTNEVLLKDDQVFQKVVEFYRTSEPGDGGAVGIYQELDLDVKTFSKINIWIVGKVLKEKGNNIANVNPPFFPEGAVQVRVKYLTADGNKKEWYHSFFYSNIIYYDKLHYSLVTKDKWFWYIGPNLLELNNKPVKIKEIRVYGFGWQFTGQVAEVNIIGY